MNAKTAEKFLISAFLMVFAGCSGPTIDGASEGDFEETLRAIRNRLGEAELEQFETAIFYSKQANWESCITGGVLDKPVIESKFRELVDKLSYREILELAERLKGGEKSRKVDLNLWRLNRICGNGYSMTLKGTTLQITYPQDDEKIELELKNVFACTDLYLDGSVTAEKLQYVHLADSDSALIIDCFKRGASPSELNERISTLCRLSGQESRVINRPSLAYSNELSELYRELEKFCKFSYHNIVEKKGSGRLATSRSIYLTTHFFWDGTVEIRDPRKPSGEAGYLDRTPVSELYFEGNWAHADYVYFRKRGHSGNARVIRTEAETKEESESIVADSNKVIEAISETAKENDEPFPSHEFRSPFPVRAHEQELRLSYRLLTTNDRSFIRIRYSRLRNLFLDPPGSPATVIEHWVINELTPIEGGLRLSYDFVQEWVRDYVGEIGEGLLKDKNSDAELLLVPHRLITTHEDADEYRLALFPTQPRFELVLIVPKTDQGFENVASQVIRSDARAFARKVSDQLNPLRSIPEEPKMEAPDTEP